MDSYFLIIIPFVSLFNSLTQFLYPDFAFPMQPDGVTEIPFEFFLKPLPGAQLHDTYHGVYVNVRYMAGVEMVRGMFSNPLKAQREFFVELNRDPAVTEKVC